MSIKTKQELITQNDALFYNNGAELIQGTTVNTMNLDIIDTMFDLFSNLDIFGLQLKPFIATASPSLTNTGVTFTYVPFGTVLVIVNGESFNLGQTINSAFYAKSVGGDVRLFNEIQVGDELHYNSSTVGYTLDTNDQIIIVSLSA